MIGLSDLSFYYSDLKIFVQDLTYMLNLICLVFFTYKTCIIFRPWEIINFDYSEFKVLIILLSSYLELLE